MRLVFIILVFSVTAFAGFFLEDDIPVQNDTREIGCLRFGGVVDFGMYLNSPDVGGGLSAEYRFHKNHSMDMYLGTLLGGEIYEAGLSWRFFFSNGLAENGHDDYFRFSVSDTYFEFDGESFFPLRISLGYGRDFMLIKDGDFLCRLEVRGSYLLRDPYVEIADNGLFRKRTHAIFNVSFGIMFF